MIKCFYCDAEADYIFGGTSICELHVDLERKASGRHERRIKEIMEENKLQK